MAYMTRAERAAQVEARLKARREAVTRELAQAQARVRSVERADRHKRQLTIGKIADEAQLLRWSDEELASMLNALGSALETLEPPDPGKWLHRVLEQVMSKGRAAKGHVQTEEEEKGAEGE